MKTLFVCLFLLVPFAIYAQSPPIEAGVSQELAKWRAAHYSDVRYKLNLTLEKMSPVLKGTIEIRVKVGAGTLLSRSPQGGELTPIILDWRKIKGFEDRSTIGNVTLNGRSAGVASPQAAMGTGVSPLRELNEHLVFREGVVAGENVIKLDFTSPILTSGSAITRYVDKEDGSEYIYSLFVPSDASTAFPVFDQPDLKARFQLSFDIPVEWRPVTNTPLDGLPVNRRCFTAVVNPADCGTFYVFKETQPISTYVFAFAAGPFAQVGDPESGSTYITAEDIEKLPLPHSEGSRKGNRNKPLTPSAPASEFTTLYVRRSQAAKFQPHAAEVFHLHREAVKYFAQYFDYKFPFPKYDLVLIPEFPFGGMEHAGATFLRESSIIFPQEPTKNDHISRATLIFHEAAHQWFGDTVTMRWFDDLWLKEGFATFMAYKAMEKIMPEMNAWKVFYERVKQAAYQTDSTKGTTPIYQPIANLSAAKSAYGAIVYNKAPAFLRQAEFYLDDDKFQAAVRTFLKKHEFGNAGWQDLVKELEGASKQDLKPWAAQWVTQRGMPIFKTEIYDDAIAVGNSKNRGLHGIVFGPHDILKAGNGWTMDTKILSRNQDGGVNEERVGFDAEAARTSTNYGNGVGFKKNKQPLFIFPNYQDYGYGIFLLDDKSRDYVLRNIQNEKDPFLRSMMWGSLWDSVREGELDPREYVELVVRNLSTTPAAKPAPPPTQGGEVRKAQARASARAISNANPAENDESTIQLLLARVSTAMNYYMPVRDVALADARASASRYDVDELRTRVENMLIDRLQNAPTLGQRITYYRAFLNVASSENARIVLKDTLNLKFEIKDLKLKTKDKFDIVTRLLILNDPDAPKLLAELGKTESSDDAMRYAYAAKAGIATAENKAKYWNDFTANKEISESWIEAAFGPWNSIRHSELTLPYLERALNELPNHKRNRKIFFVNGWLGAFIGGQRSEEALEIINKFLADNPKLDNDLRLKVLENADLIERAVKIRAKYQGN